MKFPDRNKRKSKTSGTRKAAVAYKADQTLKVYGDIYSGEIWTQYDMGEIWDRNILDITEGLKSEGKEVNKVTIGQYLRERYEGYPIIKQGVRDREKEDGRYKRTKRGKEYWEMERKRRRRSKEIKEIEDKERECDEYLKDVPYLGKSDRPLNRGEFERLCFLQCSMNEICFWFGCEPETINKWCKYTYEGKNFKEIFEVKRQGGFISIRRSQFLMSQYVPAINKFMAVNYLGMSDSPHKEDEENNKVDKLIEAIKSVE